MQPLPNVPGNNPALVQDAGALQPVPGPLPGQPLPQVLPVPQHGDAAALPAMPQGQQLVHPHVPAQPVMVGGPGNRLQPGQGGIPAMAAMVVPRNETTLEASALALNVVAGQGLQGQALQIARQTVFQNFDQVKVEIPQNVEPARFVCDQAVLSSLNLNYLELSAPLDSAVTRGSTGHAFTFQDTSELLKDALQALNATAVQRNIRPRLGIEVVAASASIFGSALDLAYSAFSGALKADKLLVYLKVECLRRQEGEDEQRFARVIDALEGHNRLQKLVLGDTCVNDSMAQDLRILLQGTPSLAVLDLSACTVSPRGTAILRAVQSAQVILPG